MNYADVATAYLTPRDTDPAPPVVPDSPARRLRDAVEPIATIGWWSQAAGEQFTAAGLDFFGGYVWGRAASLGADSDVSTVVSAFGVFDAGLVAAVLDAAKPVASHGEILASRERGAAAGLAAAAATIDPDLVASAGRRLRASMDDVDGAARPLFSGLRALPTPSDPYGALWRAAEMFREHRGDGHLAACVAAGLDQVEMNVLTELWLDYPAGEYSGTRGFAPDRIEVAVSTLRSTGWVGDDGSLTPDGRAAREEIELATDMSQHRVIAALGDDADEVIADLATIGDAVVTAHAAPADPRKRAAG
ncbi:MAG: hypothetical protein ABJH68_09015 [Ilumatobacter sp.]|uniref:SCO6745 family protein n=1 Tax=Ilumatobacter sp. TaxID=1967498 RepID=UPI0032988D1E